MDALGGQYPTKPVIYPELPRTHFGLTEYEYAYLNPATAMIKDAAPKLFSHAASQVINLALFLRVPNSQLAGALPQLPKTLSLTAGSWLRLSR